MFIVVPTAVGFLMRSTTPFIAEVLKRTTLFSALSDAELKSLAACTLIRSYPSGESVFSEGAPCVGLYIVSKGRVRIFKTSPSGREQVLAFEGPDSSIAELPVFDGGPYPASAAAMARKDARPVLGILCTGVRVSYLSSPVSRFGGI